MRTLNILAIAIITILISFCTSPDEPIDNNQLFPAKIGNYWIYERQDLTKDGDPIGKPFYDSLVIIDSKVIDDKQAFQVKFFRENIDTSTAYISAENSKIDLFGKNLNPFFKFDCNCNAREKWLSLNIPMQNSWKLLDSFPTLAYPNIDANGNVIFSQAALLLNANSERLANSTFNYKGVNSNTTNIKYSGNRILKIISPENSGLKKIQDFKYIDDKTMIEYEFDLQLSFADKIGISKIESTLQHGLKVTKSSSNLVRFEVK